METIPVGEIVTQSYRFTFRDFLKILGIVWAPLTVSIALGLMVTPGFFGNHIDPNDQDAIQRFSLRMAPLVLLIALPIRAMIATGVTEQALGLRGGITFVYFSVAAPVWRFIGSWLLVIVAMIVLIIGSAIVFGIVIAIGAVVLHGAADNAAIKVVGGFAAIASVLVFYGAILYIIVRLTFFIPPVVVVEKKIDLARAWELSRGKFWRIFAVGLALFVPMIIVVVVASYAAYGMNMFYIIDIFSNAIREHNQDVLQQQIQTWSASMRAQSLAVWPYNAVFQLIFGTIAAGLTYGAPAFAYRAIQPTPVELQHD